MPSSMAVGAFVALLLAGLAAGLSLTVGCSENLHPGSTRENACDTFAGGAVAWWLAVLWPAALYASSWLVPGLRGHRRITVLVIAALTTAFWVPLLVIVTN